MGTLLKTPVILITLSLILGMLILTGCGKKYPTVTLTIEDKGDIVIELYPKKAPATVANFISLVEEGFYDGLTFHRIVPGFVIQGGDPEGTGMGGPGYTIKGEFAMNGFTKNDLKHERGVISMARSQHPDSAGSQFFIVLEDTPGLDGQYAAFGKTIKGMDVVDEIAETPTDEYDFPTEPVIIKKATVDLPKGYKKPNENQ
ncbi:MAG: peptidylprolyl isomerase [Clostridiales bacterium]|jgi:peptidyl-prolyl cis-trans isomerase B (cyclophilin B)|nr:peptidylprolyl isomerase [Clostridiales bacterium]